MSDALAELSGAGSGVKVGMLNYVGLEIAIIGIGGYHVHDVVERVEGENRLRR